MSLFQQWKDKKSWKTQMPFVPILRLKDKPEIKDIDMREICRKAGTITLDVDSLTGFKEIEYESYRYGLNPKYSYLQEPLPKEEKWDINYVAKQLKNRLKNAFVETWDSNKKHVFSASGGRDTRILLHILAELRDELGRDWLGDIHFTCHETEGIVFQKTMRYQRWKHDEYHVYKEGKQEEADYFNSWDFNINQNAYTIPGLDCLTDTLDYSERKESVIITGDGGGQLIHRPAMNGHTDNRFNDMEKRTRHPIVYLTPMWVMQWNEYLSPFYNYQVLDFLFRVPSRLHRLDPRDITGDLIRDTIIHGIYKDPIKGVVLGRYPLRPSYDTVKRIKLDFTNSKLYNDYEEVRKYTPWLNPEEITKRKIEHKLYGLATMYEGI